MSNMENTYIDNSKKIFHKKWIIWTWLNIVSKKLIKIENVNVYKII